MAEATASPDGLLVHVSGIRVAASKLLDQLTKLAAAAGPGAGDDALAEALRQAQRALAARELARRETTLRRMLEAEPDLQRYADDAWAVADGLRELPAVWPHAASTAGAGSVAASIKEARKILEDVVLHSSLITMPTEVRQELDVLRVGKSLDFHRVFAAELPNAKQRQQILDHLKLTKICGWVDPASGLIYRLPRTTAARVFACLAPFLVALLAGAALWSFGFIDVPDWETLESSGQLLGAYGLVLAGAVVHLGIESLKQAQSRSAPILAISDGIYWLILRWPWLALTVVSIVVVTIGMRASGMGSDGDELTLYLFAGYSLDSVLGLVLTRFDSRSAAALGRLEKQLKPAEKTQPEPGAAASVATS
ncbi:MAG TPA: hypothetical protein VEQ41_00405 [Solirubrobacterales bacterium]|nr:hypothetical protein [Solirubrobacterales bacterium]